MRSKESYDALLKALDYQALKGMPTLHTGQCCSCKVDTGNYRVWVCRVGGGVSIEAYDPKSGRWETVAGGCERQHEEE